MKLFKKKAGSWIMPTWNTLNASPEILGYLQDCVDYERKTHPNDKHSNTPEEHIVEIVAAYHSLLKKSSPSSSTKRDAWRPDH